MTRNEKILKYLDIKGKGLEVGPSLAPVTPKKEGFDVESIDHASQEDLIRKYESHGGVDTSGIEPVDYIWKGESYRELTGKSKHYDWAIASHVIEHAPDLIDFINGCDEVLKDGGVFSLVIPDKRYCFDHFRPISGLGRVIDCHLNKNTVHSTGVVVEYYLNVVARGGAIAWGKGHQGEYNFVHGLKDASDALNKVEDRSSYADFHSWCFVPSSFRLIIEDLNALGLIKLKEVGFHETEGCEFYITLGRAGAGSGISRLDLVKKIEAELCES